MRYQFTLFRMAIIKKARGNKWRWGYEENRSLFTTDGSVNWYSDYGNKYKTSSKTKNWQPFDPAVPLLGIYSKERRKAYWRDVCASVFTSALFTRATLCPPMIE